MLRLSVKTAEGRELITYQPRPPAAGDPPKPATEPPHPEKIATKDELYFTGLHLEQYRHATRVTGALLEGSAGSQSGGCAFQQCFRI